MKVHIIRSVLDDTGETYCGIDENYSDKLTEENFVSVSDMSKATCRTCINAVRAKFELIDLLTPIERNKR